MVLFYNFISGVTIHAGRIDVCFRIHYVRRRDVVFIGAVDIGCAVALLTANTHQFVVKRKLLLVVVDMAHMAAAVIDYLSTHHRTLFCAADILDLQRSFLSDFLLTRCSRNSHYR